MKRTALFVCLVAGCSGSDLGTHTQSIVGGTESLGFLPAQERAVVRIETRVERGVLRCSGAAVADRAIVTAAHCVVSNHDGWNAGEEAFVLANGEAVTVLVGGDSSEPECTLSVRQIRAHPQPVVRAEIGLIEDDLAVLELASPLSEACPSVMPVSVQAPVAVNETVAVAGYGFRDEDRREQGLRQWTNAVVDQSGSSVILATTDSGALLLEGDSGGPVLVNADGEPRLVGVISTSVGSRFSATELGHPFHQAFLAPILEEYAACPPDRCVDDGLLRCVDGAYALESCHCAGGACGVPDAGVPDAPTGDAGVDAAFSEGASGGCSVAAAGDPGVATLVAWLFWRRRPRLRWRDDPSRTSS
ncbi:MAG: trypsin-like serine protease [Myxococcota bacterium]